MPLLSYPMSSAWFAAMRRGDFAAAWAISDAVLAKRDPAEADDPTLPYHQRWVWTGEPLAGRHVLVRCYHGLGDTLQFARLLPMLRPSVASITLEAPTALLGLLATLPGVDHLAGFDEAAPRRTPPGGVAIELMEVAHALRLTRHDLPGPMPWRRAREPAPATGRVGLCWQAGAWNPDRSVPLDALARALPAGLTLVSLQRGDAAAEATAPAFKNPDDRSTDVEHTAQMIDGLDLVVSVDTLVAHLAGSLGAPTLLLLKHDADWRWMTGCPSQPWYPSVQRLRQAQAGDWNEPLRKVQRRLDEIARRKAGALPLERHSERSL